MNIGDVSNRSKIEQKGQTLIKRLTRSKSNTQKGGKNVFFIRYKTRIK